MHGLASELDFDSYEKTVDSLLIKALTFLFAFLFAAQAFLSVLAYCTRCTCASADIDRKSLTPWHQGSVQPGSEVWQSEKPCA